MLKQTIVMKKYRGSRSSALLFSATSCRTRRCRWRRRECLDLRRCRTMIDKIYSRIGTVQTPKNVIDTAANILKEYCKEKGSNFDLLCASSPHALAVFLEKFYNEIRKKDGQIYSKNSMVSVRFGIQRFFQQNGKFDIVNDVTFKSANDMFKAVLVKIKRAGKGDVQHKQVISDADLKKLYSSETMNINNPEGLQHKVFFDVMYYTCRRGRENLRKMQRTDFIVHQDSNGRRYAINVTNFQTKNHRGDDLNDDDAESGRIYEKPGNPMCPLNSLEKYLDKLHRENTALWQRPEHSGFEHSPIWYDNMPVGHNTLGNFMKTISLKAGLSQTYTNHCIRATCITALDGNGIEGRHIMSLSKHKSETSIKSYSHHVCETKKHEMCSILQDKLIDNNVTSMNSAQNFVLNTSNATASNTHKNCTSNDSASDGNVVLGDIQLEVVSEADLLKAIMIDADNFEMGLDSNHHLSNVQKVYEKENVAPINVVDSDENVGPVNVNVINKNENMNITNQLLNRNLFPMKFLPCQQKGPMFNASVNEVHIHYNFNVKDG